MVDPWFRDQPATMFYCGDDEAAKAVVRQLTDDLDLEPVDAGPLVNARQLEPLAALYVYLAIFGGWGGDCAFRIVKR
jgi:8-hydroxy-5-deazaflavin:NADPH oxidoreductase